MGIIRAKKLGYDYFQYEDEGKEPEITHAIEDVDLDIQPGQFIAVLGHNGSGKSTLAKHMNALLVPTEGTMWVDHMDTSSDDDIWKIRQEAGMVFQNPDNQIVASVVEEDVGFGPENMGVPTDEIWKRVDDSLAATGMVSYRKHSPNKLSGGQKLKELRLDVPQVTLLAHELRKEDVLVPEGILTIEELVNALCR